MRTMARRLHVHWFSWLSAEWQDAGSVYGCRCGQRRPGL